jgi:hypothetical protein
MNKTATICVALLNEDVDVWRPVEAQHIGRDLYRLTGQVPEDETWPFASGEVVKCEIRTLSGDQGQREPVLVASERVKSSSRAKDPGRT